MTTAKQTSLIASHEEIVPQESSANNSDSLTNHVAPAYDVPANTYLYAQIFPADMPANFRANVQHATPEQVRDFLATLAAADFGKAEIARGDAAYFACYNNALVAPAGSAYDSGPGPRKIHYTQITKDGRDFLAYLNDRLAPSPVELETTAEPQTPPALDLAPIEDDDPLELLADRAMFRAGDLAEVAKMTVPQARLMLRKLHDERRVHSVGDGYYAVNTEYDPIEDTPAPAETPAAVPAEPERDEPVVRTTISDAFAELAKLANGAWDGIDAEQFVNNLRHDEAPIDLHTPNAIPSRAVCVALVPDYDHTRTIPATLGRLAVLHTHAATFPTPRITNHIARMPVMRTRPTFIDPREELEIAKSLIRWGMEADDWDYVTVGLNHLDGLDLSTPTVEPEPWDADAEQAQRLAEYAAERASESLYNRVFEGRPNADVQ